MERVSNIFPFNLIDKRWFYSSIVSEDDSNNGAANDATANGTAEGGSSNKPSLARTKSKIPESAEMRKVFEKFDENKDGKISSDELRQYMKRLGFELSDDELVALVKEVDDNSDGTVDFDEFYSLYSNLTGSSSSTKELAGVKESEEDHEDNLREAFQVFDKDQNGFISVEELQSVLKSLGMSEGNSLKKCNEMIQGVDVDGNGQVDFEEFKKMMNSDAFGAM